LGAGVGIGEFRPYLVRVSCKAAMCAGMALLLEPLEFQSAVFWVSRFRVPNCKWRKHLLFTGVGICLQVSLAGNEYFVFQNRFTSCPTQYCQAVVAGHLKS
jgi:hypothetical protein